MIYLLKLILFGHIHEWETVATCVLNTENSPIRGSRYTLRCKKCGHIKKVDLI